MLQHGARLRLLACMAAVATSGCTLTNPYLDTRNLNSKLACAKTQSCSAADRFIGIRDAVATMQTETRTAYVERAELNSWSSALAFPLTSVLLYGAATRSSEGARKGILGGGLLVGSAYEARNALMSGSPESTYLLAEARLACVVDEAAKYNVSRPDAGTCNTRMDVVTKQIAVVDKLVPAADMAIRRDAYVTGARNAIAQYTGMDRTISAAADHMQAAARKIVTDTNFQIRTASVSPATATALMKSEMALFQPQGKLDDSKPGGKGGGTTDDQTMAQELNRLNDATVSFASVCVIPQPQSPAAFDSCTTYSPAVPALPTITTSLTGTQFEMSPGATKTFTVTSAPSGTPWADYGGDPSAANAALGRPQIVTLTPTQSQVTLNYAKAVAKETPVVLSLYTIGVAGNAVPLTITLKPEAAGKPQEGAAAAAADAAIVKLAEDKCLMKSIEPHPVNAGELETMLRREWRNRHPNEGEPGPADLTGKEFIQKIKDGANPRPPECAAK
jgi:hypothetical protein